MIRRAAPDEVVPLRAAVLRPGLPLATAVFADDAAGAHWVAEDDGVIVGVVSVLPAPFPDGDGPAQQLRGMAVADSHRGTGAGGQLLRAVHAALAAPMWCNARAAAVGFYARHGWTVVGPPFEIPGIGPHSRMIWSPSIA